ncbi:MAG TPA: hypothetical protein VK280_17940 [Streptosporangiaceae bacterium]|nr:hypothetical protein [Streptosporangiaceae bacterium]
MLSRWLGGFAAIIVTLLTGVLVVLESTDGAMHRWWSGHSLTTDTVSGLLVLLITLLVVDQVVRLRQLNNRARAVASQAAIIMTQAERTLRSVSQAVAPGAGDSDRDAASGDLRTYMMMLLVGAPVLIDAQVSRNFLEQAQIVGGLMAVSLGVTAKSSGPAASKDARLDDAVQRLRDASTPLLAVLDPETQAAVLGDEAALPVRERSHYAKVSAPSLRRRLGCARLWGVMGGWGWRDWATSRRSCGSRRASASGCYGRPGTAATNCAAFRLQRYCRCCARPRSGRRSPRPPIWAAPRRWPGSGSWHRSGPAHWAVSWPEPWTGCGRRTRPETCRAVTYSGKSAGP